MKRTLPLFLLTILPLLGFHSESGARDREKPATIKVLIEKDVDGALLEVKGPYRISNPDTGKSLSSGRSGKRYYVFAKDQGLKWGEYFPGVFQIRIAPGSAETTMLVNGIQYRGAIEVYLIDNKLSFINEVTVESYLKSTLPNQMTISLPPSVLDAVAIIARTDAYYTALVNHDAFYHVDADKVNYQGYAVQFRSPDVERAIDNTRFLVMTYDAQPFACTWTENCAGRTASYNAIFRKNTATPKGIKSTFAAKDRKDFHWSYTISGDALAKLAKTNRITNVELFMDNKSRKVYGVRIHDGSHTEDLSFLDFQKTIGFSKLLSNDFTAKLKGNSIVFEGYGKGPSCGLCLYSGSQMAEMGEDAPKMLAEFFPYTHLEKMRSYPEMIISPSKDYFISPKKRRAITP